MKILLIHADFIEWEPKKQAIKSAEEAEKKKVRADEALVAFSAVERSDEANTAEVAKKAAAEIEKTFGEVKADSVVLYPYAHLSSNLSSPEVAKQLLMDIEGILAKKKLKVQRAPFGWYKAFDIKCKGHPLSELSKTITVGDIGGGVLPRAGKGGIDASKDYAGSTTVQMQAEKPVDPRQLLREISKQKLDR